MTPQRRTIIKGIYEFFKILIENNKMMKTKYIFDIIDNCEFAKTYYEYQKQNDLHSDLKNQCIGYEMTKCKKIGLLENPENGCWKITENGKKFFVSVKGNIDLFYHKYIEMWNYLQKTGKILDICIENNNLFTNFKGIYKDIKTTESEIEYVHRTRLVEQFERSQAIKNQALLQQNYQCFFDKKHITFPTDNYENYMEGHHIIPVSRKDSFTQDLDVVENILCLCPVCHRKIHLATNKIKRSMLEKIIERTQIAVYFNVSLDNLEKIYCR